MSPQMSWKSQIKSILLRKLLILSQSGGIPPYDSEDSYEKREEKEGDEETTKGTGFAGEEEVQWEREILERLSHQDFCH